MKFYRPHYGSTHHDPRPQFEMRGNAIYTTRYHPGFKPGAPELPWFENKSGKIYATEYHPEGKSLHPLYEVHGDKVHSTAYHPHHNPTEHTFEIRPH